MNVDILQACQLTRASAAEVSQAVFLSMQTYSESPAPQVGLTAGGLHPEKAAAGASLEPVLTLNRLSLPWFFFL